MDTLFRYGKRVIILSLIYAITAPVWNCETAAQEESSEEPIQRSVSVEFDTKIISLSLKESILFAIRNNFDVEIARMNPGIGDLDITIEKAKFDPVFKVEGSVAENQPLVTVTNKATGFAPIRTDRDIFTSTVERLFETGGTLSLGYGFTYNRFITPLFASREYTTFVEAKLTQPLLKGAWFFYNLSPIYIARNNKQISILQFKDTVIQTVDQVQDAYWNLVKAIEDLKVARKSLERAEDLLVKNKLQVEAGMLTPIDVLEAEAEVASREEAVISAEHEIMDNEDILKQVINLSDGSILSDAPVVPVDKPVFDAREANMLESTKLALQNRPDLLETLKKVENAGISVKLRRNELLPRMDINGTFRYEGISESSGEEIRQDLGDSHDVLLSQDFENKSIGLSIEIPIGLRSARSNYKKAKLEVLQAEIDVKKVEQQVVVDVREAVRHINTNIKRVFSTRKAREFADRKLDAEEKKFNVGKTTNLEVLRAQEDLAIAEGNETKAIIDYQMSLGDLDVATATILEKHDIRLKEEYQ
ncbi:MAG: TolC family protein [Candidatus Brocadiales bacterium]